jgi:hypothetical protein
MSVTTPTIYNGMYLGQMEPKIASYILDIRGRESIPNLKHMIFDFPAELVLRSIEEEKSIRDIVRDEQLDYKKYLGELKDYQTLGTAFMYMSPRSVIGDGVGLGKTAEVSALINYLHQTKQLKRFLMAVETSALGQTQCELMRFTGLRVVALPSEAYKLNRLIKKIDWTKVDGIVIKHSALRSDVLSKWLSLNINPDGTCRLFDTFFLDESSVIKNLTTKTAIYTKNICDICPRVHFMNATVFETNIMDIYNQMDMMNPALLPKKWRIEKEFCTFGRSSYWTKENGKPKMNFRRDLTGYKNQAIFKERLKLVYFGRSKSDIGMDMPHVHKVYEVEPSNEQSMALQKGYRYMEVLNCPSLIPDLHLETNRKTVPKLDRLCNLLETDFADCKVMVYCFHNEAQQAIADECRKLGRNPVILNGQSKDQERWEIQTKFNKGEYDVIITNIMKSLNLFGGDVCIFYSNSMTPSKMFQVAGRIDRNVDDKIKTYILLIYSGTDEYKHFMEVTKQRTRDARDLTIDAKTTVDYFIESMVEEEEAANAAGLS